MTAQYAIGIDLGTTNSVLAFAPLNDDSAAVSVLLIPQHVAPSEVESRESLPSFLHLAQAEEASSGALDLPWAAGREFVVGELARRRAAEEPTRTVAAAKSWLGHHGVDRRAAILPWNAPESVAKVSPVEASRRYLEHLVAVWNQAFGEAPLHEQQVVLTAPASFDAGARDLTREAATAAGLGDDFVLLEEPQAAVYAWLADAGEAWRQRLAVGDVLLVCDVGGGTSDFSLIEATEVDGSLELRRIAVGDHILTGGDNMDLALAHFAAAAFDAQGVKLDAWQSVALWHSCRAAKEQLLAAGGPEKHPVTVLGRGSKLIGGAKTVELEAKKAAKLLVDGFFPRVAADERPQRRRASGFREVGLPYESDPAITRHLAAFLAAHGDSSPRRPSRVLFNGGVFQAEAFRQRVLRTLGDWFPDDKPQPLEGSHDLDHAVARGAAYYAAAKQGRGVRIRGGTARSYYLGIETAGLAIPGAPRPLSALCVAPFGMEEGTQTTAGEAEASVVLGQPERYRFFASTVRKDDQPGDFLNQWAEGELVESDSLESTLEATDDGEQYATVRFETKVTELGVLELWCVESDGPRRWKFEFSVREESEG